MDYFKILNLNREPFSNSPEPDFFFPPPSQLAVLQQLEIAIRLRRGLNIVAGEVGTGKSTLCRQLIIRLSASEADRQEIEASLIMDPSFSTPREFLNVVAGCLGIVAHEESTSEWKMKEAIKNALYQKGVVESKIIVIIIDEGQKIPGFTIEIIREFLNYETNENKLLQIVIFAQNEFRETLATVKNFTDRVNRYHSLSHLKFGETRGMIDFRLQRAAAPDRAPVFFTKPALLAIYLATGGFPRRIITLCHNLLLAMIIKNRTKANFFFVQANIVSAPLAKVRRQRLTKKTAAMVTVLLLSLIMIVFLSTVDNIVRRILATYQMERQKVALSGTMPMERQTPLPPAALYLPEANPVSAFAIAGPPPANADPAVERRDRRFIKLKRTWLHEDS